VKGPHSRSGSWGDPTVKVPPLLGAPAAGAAVAAGAAGDAPAACVAAGAAGADEEADGVGLEAQPSSRGPTTEMPPTSSAALRN